MTTTEPPDRDLGQFLFRFAVLADTHINPTDGESPSPWLTNRQANARSRAVVQAINGYQPAFVVHLGDIVHPVPSQGSYPAAARQARAVLDGLTSPLHCVPGNHDMGDKYVEWAPAAVVTDPFLAVYEAHFGKDFFSFQHAGCHFMIVNSQVLNSGLEREREQWEWLETELAHHAGERTFLFSHYPPYVAEPDEIEHYDNMGEPARGRLLGLALSHGVTAIFAGHVHNFFYDRAGGCDLYVLPAVSAVRHDYSELFRTPPADSDHGRDDNAKLGFFIVDVYEHDHVAHFVRSYGATSETTDERSFRHAGTHTRVGVPCPVGVDMRHAWAKPVEIPYQGVVDEFYRKRARNDYALAALWEMGVSKLRVPIGDLTDPESRARMATLQAVGHRFLVFSYDVPRGQSAAAVDEHRQLVDGLEVVLPGDRIDQRLGELGELAERTGVEVYLSKLRSSAEAKAVGARYTHFISHGFGEGDEHLLSSLPDHALVRRTITGLVLRVEAGASVHDRLTAGAEWARAAGMRAVVHVTLADENPAQAAADDLATANRVAEAMFCAHVLSPSCAVYLDTFADMDRGYFPRRGLVDRRFNPRLAGRVFAALGSELASAGSLRELTQRRVEGFGRVLSAENHQRQVWLLLPDHDARLAAGFFESVAARRTIDLATAEIRPELSPAAGETAGRASALALGDRPLLVIGDRGT